MYCVFPYRIHVLMPHYMLKKFRRITFYSVLNPPLSLQRITCFHCRALPSSQAIRNLPLADRAITQFCQNIFFQTLELGIPSSWKRFKSEKLWPPIKFALSSWRNRMNGFSTIQPSSESSSCSGSRLASTSVWRTTILSVTIENPVLVVGLLATFWQTLLAALSSMQREEFPLPVHRTCFI